MGSPNVCARCGHGRHGDQCSGWSSFPPNAVLCSCQQFVAGGRERIVVRPSVDGAPAGIYDPSEAPYLATQLGHVERGASGRVHHSTRRSLARRGFIRCVDDSRPTPLYALTDKGVQALAWARSQPAT